MRFDTYEDDDLRRKILESLRAEFRWMQSTGRGQPEQRLTADFKQVISALMPLIGTRVPSRQPDPRRLSQSLSRIPGESPAARKKRAMKGLVQLYRSNVSVRSDVLRDITRTGSEASLDLVTTAIARGTRAEVDGAAFGARIAAAHRRATPAFKRRTFDALTPIVTGSTSTRSGCAAVSTSVQAVLSLDTRRALSLLKSERCVRPENGALFSVLIWLNLHREHSESKFGRPIDPRLLWTVFDAARRGKARTMDASPDRLMGALLTFTADLDPERTAREARKLIEAAKGELWSQSAEFAMEALKRCKRIPEPRSCLSRLERSPRSFGPAATSVLRAYELAEHVLTDGLVLYYHNCGKHLQDAAAGLRLMKRDRAADLLAQGTQVLVPNAMAQTAQALRRAYDSLSGRQSAKLRSIEKAFERVNDSILEGVERYIARHPGEFRTAQSRPYH